MINYIKKGQKQYKANLHSHSVISDGCLTPEEMKKAYKDRGYSILAITDHEAPCAHNELTEKDFLMITGYEAYIRHNRKFNAYVPEIHINLIAEDKDNVKYIGFYDDYSRYLPKEEQEKLDQAAFQGTRDYEIGYINDFIKASIENGYICFHNHPYWSLELFEQISKYEGFVSMEMCNYGSHLTNRCEYNGQLYDRLLREGKRLFVHSADDNHNPMPFDAPDCDSFGAFTMILADELSYESVIRAIKKGDMYSSMGPIIKELTFDGERVHIETTPARQITMMCSGKRMKAAYGNRENPATCGDFEIPKETEYVRFNVYDFEGNYADTRAFFRDELGI